MRQEGGNPLWFALKFLGESENKQMKPFVPKGEKKKKKPEQTAQTHHI